MNRAQEFVLMYAGITAGVILGVWALMQIPRTVGHTWERRAIGVAAFLLVFVSMFYGATVGLMGGGR